MKDLLFSLDIGTRNVVGVLSRIEDDKYIVVDYEMLEHPERAMYDGQIHDISKVANVANRVKEILEKRNDIELKYVSIAAAGRALKTKSVIVEFDSDSINEINKNDIDSLNLLGIEHAQRELTNEENLETSYYCVGYSVINYFLDGKTIGNLKGHKGSKLGAEVLATFLPHVVVDSLYTVVHRIGLEVINMTLEPIAAINIAIPENFRLLNLALVDIGAGTSDIAITKDGSITSYSMVAFAGDKLTEALSQQYLLDFATAEKLKTKLSVQDDHEFLDIVGMSHSHNTQEIMDKLSHVLDELSTKIGKSICQCNGKSPSAIFCIGGSSKIPGLQKYLADKLDMPMERIVIKNTSDLTNVEFLGEPMDGPEFVTPLGIGYTAYKDKEQDFLKVTVNDKLVRLFKSRELSVSDALLLVGFSARKLLGKKGKSITVNINGVNKVLHGELGEPATIFVNDTTARLDSKVHNNDEIRIVDAINGRDARVYIKDLIDVNSHIIVNGEKVYLNNELRINGKHVDEDYRLCDGDVVRYSTMDNLNSSVEAYLEDAVSDVEIKVNGVVVNSNYKPCALDEIAITKLTGKVEELEKKDDRSFMEISINDEVISLEKRPGIMFVEIFNHIDFDLNNPKGNLQLSLNGARANYTDILSDGDVIKLDWK